MGQTVEVLKSHIEAEYGISMMEQRLYYEESLMLDPLSLLDYFPEKKITNKKVESGKEEDDCDADMELESGTKMPTRVIPKEMYVVVEGDMAKGSRK